MSPAAPLAADASRFAARLAAREGKALLAALRPTPARGKSSPDDPVTDADVAVEGRILAALGRRFPSHGLYGEEGGFARGPAPLNWIVDPIDGTGNFARGLPLFAVSIALLEDGVPIAAAAFSGLERVVYRAARGEGAWKGEERLRIDPKPRDGLRLVGAQPRRGMRSYTPRLLGEVGKLRRLGSAVLQLLAVAGSGFHACFDERARFHDLAGAVLIVREAGGTVLRLDGSPIERFDLGAEGRANPIPCVAGTAESARWLLGLLR